MYIQTVESDLFAISSEIPAMEGHTAIKGSDVLSVGQVCFVWKSCFQRKEHLQICKTPDGMSCFLVHLPTGDQYNGKVAKHDNGKVNANKLFNLEKAAFFACAKPEYLPIDKEKWGKYTRSGKHEIPVLLVNER